MANLINQAQVIESAFERGLETNKIPEKLIEAVQVRHVLPILGETFYDLVDASPATYSDLVTVLKPYIAYMVKFYVLPTLYVEIGTVGMARIQGNNRSLIGRPEYEDLRQQTLDMAQMYATVATKYLDDNSATYSSYYLGNNPEEKIVHAGGIIFHKTNPFDTDTWWNDDDDYTIHLRNY